MLQRHGMIELPICTHLSEVAGVQQVVDPPERLLDLGQAQPDLPEQRQKSTLPLKQLQEGLNGSFQYGRTSVR